MKKLHFVKSILFAGLFAAGLSSCGSDDSGESRYENLNVTANGNGLTTFVTAVGITNITPTLESGSDFTVFAPTNAAFDQFLGENGYASIEAVPVPLLKEILYNHIIRGDVASSDLATGYRETVAHGPASSTSALDMYVRNDQGIKLNNKAVVTTADIRASNGRIHIVDKVIPLPSVITHLQSNSQFSLLLSGLQAYPASQFVQTLSGTGNSYPFTIIAPTNAGMNNILSELDADNIADISQANLEKILSYHVLTGQNKLYPEITDGTYQTLAGQSFNVQNTGGGKKITDVRGRVSTFGENITRDIQAWNGVIHIVDNGLLPNL